MSMPDDSFRESIDSIDLKDALALAAYIEQLLMGTSKNEEFQACSHLQKNALRRQEVY